MGAPGLCLSMLARRVVFGLKTAYWEVKIQGRERDCGIGVCFSTLDGWLVPSRDSANQAYREHPDLKRTQWGKGLLALN